jgi:hypothetical protein
LNSLEQNSNGDIITNDLKKETEIEQKYKMDDFKEKYELLNNDYNALKELNAKLDAENIGFRNEVEVKLD